MIVPKKQVATERLLLMQDDDLNLFQSQVADVKPLQQDRVHLPVVATAIDVQLRRARAENHPIDAFDPLSSSAIDWLSPFAEVGFKRPGLQDAVYKKLRSGKYSCDARLDLHGFTVDAARVELFRFIQECLQYELRSVMVLHGKADRNPEKQATLKSHAVHWLQQMDEVLAFHSAQQHHGGSGALYVLLKKTESAKQRNREQHGLR